MIGLRDLSHVASDKVPDTLKVPNSALSRWFSNVSVKKVAARLTTNPSCRTQTPSEPVPMNGSESTERLS